LAAAAEGRYEGWSTLSESEGAVTLCCAMGPGPTASPSLRSRATYLRVPQRGSRRRPGLQGRGADMCGGNRRNRGCCSQVSRAARPSDHERKERSRSFRSYACPDAHRMEIQRRAWARRGWRPQARLQRDRGAVTGRGEDRRWKRVQTQGRKSKSTHATQHKHAHTLPRHQVTTACQHAGTRAAFPQEKIRVLIGHQPPHNGGYGIVNFHQWAGQGW
jgi:hypothetical protein